MRDKDLTATVERDTGLSPWITKTFTRAKKATFAEQDVFTC